MLPIGWAVFDARGGAALFLERAAADQFAVRVHGLLQPVYSGVQIAGLIEQLEQLQQAQRGHTAQQGAAAHPQVEGGFACSRH